MQNKFNLKLTKTAIKSRYYSRWQACFNERY